METLIEVENKIVKNENISMKQAIDKILDLSKSQQFTTLGSRARDWARCAIDSDSDDEEHKSRQKTIKHGDGQDMPKLEMITNGKALTPQQENFINKVIVLRKNIFLTGPGGVGKTFTLQELANRLKSRGKTFFLVATTGVAAINMVDGTEHTSMTLHSWMGLGLMQTESVEDLVRRVFTTSGIRLGRIARQRWLKCEFLIIEEISMLDPRLIEILHEVACAVRNSTKPFGGITIVFAGDFAQLKPVKSTATVSYAFQHPLWAEFKIETVYLNKAFRFNKEDWASMLLRIRMGKETKADYKLLKTRLIDEEEEERQDSKKSIQRKREQAVLSKITNKYEPVADIFQFTTTEIHSKKDKVQKINERERNAIQPNPKMLVNFHFTTSESGRDQSNSSTLDAWLTNQRKECLSKEDVELCTGAQVMLTANVDVKSGLANGSCGIVVGWGKLGEKKPGCSMTEIYPIVRFTNGVVSTIGRREWKYTSNDHKSFITYCQVPLMYSWALTFHKVQGLTLERARMDVGDDIFTSGQAYVGLSRVKSLEGVELIDIDRSSIYADEEVVEFYESLEKAQQVENT